MKWNDYGLFRVHNIYIRIGINLNSILFFRDNDNNNNNNNNNNNSNNNNNNNNNAIIRTSVILRLYDPVPFMH